MSHDPMPNEAPPVAGSQAGGAGALAPELMEQLFKESLFKEFYVKCGPFRNLLSIAFGDRSVTKKAFDLYTFIVFNKTLDRYGEDVVDADVNPPEQLIQEITSSIPRVTVDKIKTYAKEFNDFKAESARRVIEVCRRLEKRKLKRFNTITAEAVKSIYELAAKESRDNVRLSLKLQADLLAEARFRELFEKFLINYNSFPDDLIPILSNIERRIAEGTDRSLLVETIAKELRKIARVGLKAKRKEALQLTSFLSA